MLFVCLGNICRSPLAEAAFRAEAERRGLDVEVDSAGTGDWHVGEPPDPRARALARAKGLPIDDLRARQLAEEDFYRFTHIFALDEQNLEGIRARAPAGVACRIGLLLDLVPGREGEAVADPYFGEEAGFEVTWADVSAAARAFAERLERE
ncbi:phosphotyrosine protein phosphatase [Altererythrobacter sp. B11]|nr:phosphotyrosine protein phosphatase [Altererythrobacter sp. B11]